MHIFSSNVHDKLLDSVDTQHQVIVVALSRYIFIACIMRL